MPTYPFIRDDGGRSQSKRPKQRDDCTVRALAIVTATSYDAVYELLSKEGRASAEGFYLDRWLLGTLDPIIGEPETVFGWKAERMTFPPVKGQRRMNPVTFATRYPTGRYLCFTAGHVYAVLDGVMHDNAPEAEDRCIYKAWRFYR